MSVYACLFGKVEAGLVRRDAAERLQYAIEERQAALGDARAAAEAPLTYIALNIADDATRAAARRADLAIRTIQAQLATLEHVQAYGAKVKELRATPGDFGFGSKAPALLADERKSTLWPALRSLFWRDPHEIATGGNVYYLSRTIKGEAHAMFAQAIELLRPKMLGLKRETAREFDMLGALYGAADATPEGRVVAQSWGGTAKSLFDQFNAAGGAIPERQGWRIPKPSWTFDQVEDLIYPPPPPPEPDAGGDHDGGDDRPPCPPSDSEDTPPVWKLKKRPIKPLPKDFPVVPLGIDGEVCFYLTPTKQFLPLESHSAEALRKLCAGALEALWNFHPKFKENTGEQTNWDAARTADSLIQACGLRGPFDPSERLRGTGAWRGDQGELILHAGDQVFDGREWQSPGFLGAFVYPGAAPLPHPAEIAEGDEARQAQRLLWRGEINAFLSLLDTWNWAAEFDMDPETGEPLKIGGHRLCSILVLGWIAGALVGGALDWRPMIWLTGDAATGKSTLQKLIALVMGASLVSSSDATAAGIYQSVGYSSRAAGIDEAEADPFSAKMKGMVELVRQSASGGSILRGSNDPKKWRGFTARSAFLLSSIVIPPLFGQDLTRITILPLAPLPKRATKPKLEPARWAAFGRQLRCAILAGWPRWAETLERYQAELAVLGHDGRGGDQIGTLLAMADMVMHEEAADSDTVSILCAPFELRNKPKAESNAEQMLNWLISKTVVAFRGGNQMTIGKLVSIAAAIENDDSASAVSAAMALQAHGVFVEGDDRQGNCIVILPNQSAGLAQLLDGSPWGTKPGAAISGWQQAMQRLATQRGPDGQPAGKKTNSRKHGGRGWSLPVKIFLRQEEE